MKISELQPQQGNINVEVEVLSIEEPREFDKYGKTLRVANAQVKDDSGEIKMSLWNEDIDKVKPGMKLKIENGYCSEFKGEKQFTTGKFGKFEVISGGSEGETKSSEKNAEPADEESPAEPQEVSEEDNTI